MATKNITRNESTYFVEDFLYHFVEWFKRLWIVALVLAVICSAGLSFYTYYRFVPSYSVSATFTVNVDVRESSDQSYNKATANQLAKTFPNILTSSSLNKVICSDLGVDSINATITASVLEDTNLFTITVVDSNAQRAYDVLQSVISNYPQVAKFVIGSTQLSLIDTSAISTMPTNIPNYTKKAIMGALAGAFVGIALILLLALTTTTIIRADDITRYFNAKCLGSVPELYIKKRSKEIDGETPDITNKNINFRFREGIYTARNAVIRECQDKGYKTIAVTSTVSGEGKSIVAMNLAESIALKGYKTCLVDFDLRVPSLCEYLSIDESINSVSDYIKGNCEFKNCVYATRLDNFYIAIEKNKNPDASELVGNQRAIDLVAKLRESFEFVIIDTPPTGYLADASVIGDYVDAGIYVIAQDMVSRRSIRDGLATFDSLNAELIGCVLNRITKGIESVRYSKYSYRRYSKKYNYSKYDTESIDTPITTKIDGVEFEEE